MDASEITRRGSCYKSVGSPRSHSRTTRPLGAIRADTISDVPRHSLVFDLAVRQSTELRQSGRD